ncbi:MULTISPECIES: serine/threonine-protein kinase [Pseudofrankia]|uniref:serine/threonine-protein kinase n=1 Tax=Pseudofrankia TaxID=2994363 RepID=UPI000A64F900|nr:MULTISPECIES: serine/threonine-protein kinase [Pseudofrankia]
MLTPLGPADRRVVGSYRLRGRLGAGGMGTVFLGVDPDGQPAAVKVIRSDLLDEPQFRERFSREITAARRVRGTRVAQVLDADPDADEPWMATEYVEGVNLLTAVARHGALSGPNLTALATGLAEGLVAVHAAGVVHRDLKPANILLTWEGPKIIDFGLARADDLTGNTSGGSVIGTVAWMAPEQLNGDPATTATDIFNWGMCVAFAARGEHPFDAQTPAATAMRILSNPPGLDGVPADLLPMVTAALDRDPNRRPGAIRLLATINDQPKARPTGVGAPARGPVAGAVPPAAAPAPDAPPATARTADTTESGGPGGTARAVGLAGAVGIVGAAGMAGAAGAARLMGTAGLTRTAGTVGSAGTVGGAGTVGALADGGSTAPVATTIDAADAGVAAPVVLADRDDEDAAPRQPGGEPTGGLDGEHDLIPLDGPVDGGPGAAERHRRRRRPRRRLLVLLALLAVLLLASTALVHSLLSGSDRGDTAGGSSRPAGGGARAGNGGQATAPGADGAAAAGAGAGTGPGAGTGTGAGGGAGDPSGGPSASAGPGVTGSASPLPGEAGPSGGPPAATLPRATTTGRPLDEAAASRTTVQGDGGAAVAAYRGPSTGGLFGGQRGTVPNGSPVDIYCGLYAQQVSGTTSTSRLWVYTDSGWIPAGYIQSGSSEPLSPPACVGTVSSPKLGSNPPRSDTGPFPLTQEVSVLGVVGQVVSGLTGALLGQADPIGRLLSGDLVVLRCQARAADTGEIWDQLTSGGWIQHAYVYSGTSGSPAPAC